MAATLITGTAFGNTNTRIAFSSVLHRESKDKMWLTKRGMISRDTGGEGAFERSGGLPIRSVEALNNRRAQEVRIGMMNQLTTNRTQATGVRSLGVATYGSAAANLMSGSEETAALRGCTVYVEQSKHATSTVTPEIQDLRTEFKVTAQLGGLLTDWMAQEDEENHLDAFYDGYSGHVVGGVSSASAADPPAANLRYAGGAADDVSLGTTNRLTPAELRTMWGWLTTSNINPIRMPGMEDCYVLLVHPLNLIDLYGNSEFQTIYAQGADRGQDSNPIFGKAEVKYMNIYIHAYNRIRSVTGASNVRRCLLLGADAVAAGTTVRPRLVRRKEDDYEDVLGIGIKSIHGEARFDWAPVSGTTLNQAMAIWGIYTAAAA